MDNNKSENPFNQEPKKDFSSYILDDSDNDEVIEDLPFNTKDDDIISNDDIKICTDPASAFYNEQDGSSIASGDACQDNLLNDLTFNNKDNQEIDSRDVAICDDPAGAFFMKPGKEGTTSGVMNGSGPSGISDFDGMSSGSVNGSGVSRNGKFGNISSGYSGIGNGASGANNASGLSNIGGNLSSGISGTGSSKIPDIGDVPFGIRSTLPKEEIEILTLTEDKIAKENLKNNGSSDADRHVKNSKSTTNKYVILLVTLGALLMMWYTTFAQPLGFNNTQKQVSDDNGYVSWDIRFTDMYQKRKVGSAKEISAPSYNATKANFHVALSNPGDEITYNLTIKNAGTLNAKISSIYVMPENSNDDAILYYVDGIKVGDFLDAGQSTNMTVTAKFNENVTSAVKNVKSVSVIINYVQR